MAATLETSLDQVTDKLRAAVARQQQDGDPSHEDFYTWGWALSELTARTQDASRLLARQIASYGDRRILRDDEGADPADRLDQAAALLATLANALGQANAAARQYHSAISHVGVQVDPS